jgi:hypothetical protein
VVIPAAQASATVTVNVLDDPTVEGDETVVLTLAAGTDYAVGTPGAATVTIQDDDATVTVAATDATASEPGGSQGSGTLTFTRTGFTGAALTVNYTVGGTATSGSDFSAIGTSVVIPASQASATQTVNVLDDPDVEGNETVIATLASGTGYTIGAPSAATVTIQDDDVANVTVAATDATAGEPQTGAGSGTFTVSRTGPTTSPMTVNFTVGGTASSGSDYTALGTSVVIPAAQASATVTVNVLDDPAVEGDETVVLTLAAGTVYAVGTPGAATVTIQDDDATVTVAATDGTAGEPGSSQGDGTFTVTRTGFLGVALTVNYTVGGTATSGSDYTAIGTSVVIPASQASVPVTVSVLGDSDVEANETVVLTLTSGSGYVVGTPSAATVTIQADDVVSVTIAATDPTAGEPLTNQGTGTFTISRTGPTTAPLTVNFTVGGTATSGSDYTALGTSVVIPASQASEMVTVTVIDDGDVEGNETVMLTLAAGTGYTVGTPSSATVTIHDDDATVTVAATDATAGEPSSGQGTGTFTFTRTGFTGAALTVNYTVTGTATSGSDYTAIGTTVQFGGGSSTATQTVSVIDDPAVEGDETVILTLAAGSYTVGNAPSATVTIKDDDAPIIALVRHAPVVNGSIDGSVQMLLGENFSLSGNAMISGDLLVPGTPTVLQSATATYGGTLDGPGSVTPTGYSITLNDNALLRHVVRRIDPIALPVVAAPPAPAGTRIVSLTAAGQSPGDFATLRNLSLNLSAGLVVVPPGTYGSFSASGNSGFVLGVPGATVPAVYNFQSLALNILPGTAQIQVVGPVIINLANGSLMNGPTGSLAHPEWLTMNVAAGGLTLSGNFSFHGSVVAPNSAITLNSNVTLNGTLVADRLTINGTSVLNDPNP